MIQTPFIPSPIEVVRRALDIALVGRNDILFDLGAGDGRVVIEAAKRGAIGVGVEIDPFLCQVIREKAKEEGVQDRVRVIEADFFTVDLGQATIIYSYQYRSVHEKLAPKLESELKLGARVVAIDFPIPGWIPVRVHRMIDSRNIVHTIFLYVIGASNPKALIKRVHVVDYLGLLGKNSGKQLR